VCPIHKFATVPLIALAALIDIPMALSYARLSVDNIDAQWQLAFLPLIPAIAFAFIAMVLSLAVWPIQKWLFGGAFIVLCIPSLIIVAIRHWYFLR
jgi:hypothetical protein